MKIENRRGIMAALLCAAIGLGLPAESEAAQKKRKTSSGRSGRKRANTLYEGGDRSFSSCAQARAAGAAPLRKGKPGYSRRLDRDGDGVACE